MEGNVDIGISGSDMLEEAVSLAQQSGARPFWGSVSVGALEGSNLVNMSSFPTTCATRSRHRLDEQVRWKSVKHGVRNRMNMHGS